jgi:DNA phosphorothioation-associated putative methyltransferase
VMASLGIAYVFKDAARQAEYFAQTAQARPQLWREDVLDSFRRDRIARRFLKAAETLGRVPLPEEFSSFGKLVQRFGSTQRIVKITTSLLSQANLESARCRRRDELLLYIAMMKLRGLKCPPFKFLPPAIRADLRVLWPNYQLAQEEGEAFLFQMGQEEVVRKEISNANIGKRLPDALYFHRSCLDQLSPLLRLIISAAFQVVGDVEHDIVKMSSDGRKVSLLRYPRFDEDPHPTLAYSYKVYLPTATHGFRDYQNSLNPPILHRKDSLVDPLYPRYSDFKALTLQEEEHGLLSRTDIGFRTQWENVLKQLGLSIGDHRISPASTRFSKGDEHDTESFDVA